MQLIGAGEATHSCWRAAIVLVWGCPLHCVGCLDGRRHDTDWPLQRNNTRRARRTVGRTKTTLRFLVCLCMLGPRFVCLLNCLCSMRSGREELYSSCLGRRGSLRLVRVRGSQT